MQFWLRIISNPNHGLSIGPIFRAAAILSIKYYLIAITLAIFESLNSAKHMHFIINYSPFNSPINILPKLPLTDDIVL